MWKDWNLATCWTLKPCVQGTISKAFHDIVFFFLFSTILITMAIAFVSASNFMPCSWIAWLLCERNLPVVHYTVCHLPAMKTADVYPVSSTVIIFFFKFYLPIKKMTNVSRTTTYNFLLFELRSNGIMESGSLNTDSQNLFIRILETLLQHNLFAFSCGVSHWILLFLSKICNFDTGHHTHSMFI